MPVPAAGRLFGFGKTKSYEEAHRYLRTDGREGLPALRFGRSMVCPTTMVLKLLGVDPHDTTGAAQRTAKDDPNGQPSTKAATAAAASPSSSGIKCP